MPKIKTRNDFNINYEIAGNIDSEHTLILSHGNGNCLNDWTALGYVERLAPHFKLVLMDALGYGESDKPTSPAEYTAEKRADDVIDLLNALDIEQCHFFGNSIGGSLGFVLAHRYPDHFLSFSIGSAHPYGSSQPIGCNLYSDEFKDKMRQDGVRNFVAYVETVLLDRNFPSQVKANFLKNDLDAIIAANTPIWPDYSEFLSSISVPVMLFAGKLDPVSEYLPAIAQDINNATVNILEGKDHPAAYWESEIVTPLILQFINENFSSYQTPQNGQ